MKKITIIRSSGNELANQLWNYASVYAFTLEKQFLLRNPAFFEYGEYFNINASPNRLFRIIFFKPFKNYTERKTALKRRVWRKIYNWYSIMMLYIYKSRVITSNNKVFYLPPTIKILTDKNCNYLDGWLFRNPIGIEKYRKEIHEYFTPRKDIGDRISNIMINLRNKYNKIIGIHIRQSDYKTWKNGMYFLDQKRIREIIDEFILQFNIDISETCFVFTSDGKIDSEIFNNLNVYISKEIAVTDLFLLASTDIILGSNSTFGAFASYYGNVPFIVMQKQLMDWEYYKDKISYFENKYSTMVNY